MRPKNPGGIATYGFIVRRDKEVLHRESGVAGEPFSLRVSNNVAEYTALIRALQWLLDNNYHKNNEEEIIVRGDSQFVILQLKGIYSVKSARVIPLYQEVNEPSTCWSASLVVASQSNVGFHWNGERRRIPEA